MVLSRSAHSPQAPGSPPHAGLLLILGKKLRDDRGYWERLEEFIVRRTGAKFTHGICPGCKSQYFGGAS